MIFYNFSGGMESAAMLALDVVRIQRGIALDRVRVRFADTGKQFPEMGDSLREIEHRLAIKIHTVHRRISFDEFLFERGGMIRKGTNDCSRRMKRGNLMADMKRYAKPYEVNLGFNFDEQQRADDFIALNERDWLHWRFPLIELGISHDATWEICRKAGFSILLAMYEKMGRFDCFWCGNQKKSQAHKVAIHYPELAKEWMEAEERKGHSFMPISLKMLTDEGPLFSETSSGCSCFGGNESVHDEDETNPA